MYRFHSKRTILSYLSGLHISLLLFAGILFLFLYALSGISAEATDRQESSLRTAVNRSIVSCYCVEGTYPPSLDYLVTHYGLTYDPDVFFVDYRAIGSNILPDVTIIRK